MSRIWSLWCVKHGLPHIADTASLAHFSHRVGPRVTVGHRVGRELDALIRRRHVWAVTAVLIILLLLRVKLQIRVANLGHVTKI